MTFIKHMKKAMENSFFIRILKNKNMAYFFITFIFIGSMFFSIISEFTPNEYDLKAGNKAPADIKAPRDVEDKSATQRLIQREIASVENIEKFYPTIQIDVKKNIEKFFNNLYQIRAEEILDYEKIGLLKSKNKFLLDDEDLEILVNGDVTELKNVESYVYEIVSQIMSSGIRPHELENKKQEIEEYFKGLEDFSNDTKSIGTKIVNNSIKANRFVDVETTKEKIEEARNSVEKVMIKRGSIIVGEGEIITPDHISVLKDLGVLKEDNKRDMFLYLGALGVILMTFLTIILYIYFFNRPLLQSPRKLYLLIILYVFVFYISKSLFYLSPYIGPVAAFTCLVGILIEPKLALVISISMTIMLSISKGYNVEFIYTNIMASIVATCGIKKASQRSTIFLTGLMISFSNIIILTSIGLINHYDFSLVFSNVFNGLLNGIFCAVITIGSLPLWEWAFKILTPFKLLELSNPNNKLLKRLLLEAPGTYHHSIIVGNLSENAAQSIGANSLLARVGAYYHDIGKLRRPYLFKENQLTSENPHDKLKPIRSVNVITSHIKDGVDFAKEEELPQEIVDIIFQHHGTTLVKFFYFKATQNSKKTINESDYRYKGEKPKSKEAAVVMLADSVEAAVRSIKEPTEEKIRDLIDKIVKDKLNDSQFDECNMTLKDLKMISESFMTILMGIFHERIEYPDMDKDKKED
ncbi:MAG: HDIG domain-containing protein [Anaeromicrobium sp.]|uniref:HD family phosphohydrolase n=1 Tax=Anaeromicrobium sp. TaxID=1929132 RepID=UPI0025E3C518|nr:HDIG domain-containing metalloprotein [Anaeromicrobium sp.]MCT4594591.1 HDIG domain-containing protein [Anaeromicrobium sp.]